MNGVGLANNGGSRTLVRCVETMRSIGIPAFFYCGKSHYTWHDADIECVGGDKHPKCDITIATGFNSWKSVARYKGRRAAYIRGYELWKAPEPKLLESFRSIDGALFANSQWIADRLKDKGFDCTVQYPGLDEHWFYDMGGERPLRVGALRNNRHGTKRIKDIDKLGGRLGFEILQLNRHIKKPNSVRLNKWYNDLKVWFAPTELEGLHNPPIEAALAGCALVCTDHPRGGMLDYAIHGETALVYPARDIKKAEEYVRLLLDDEALRRTLNTNLVNKLRAVMGSREERMREFVDRLRRLQKR